MNWRSSPAFLKRLGSWLRPFNHKPKKARWPTRKGSCISCLAVGAFPEVGVMQRISKTQNLSFWGWGSLLYLPPTNSVICPYVKSTYSPIAVCPFSNLPSFSLHMFHPQSIFDIKLFFFSSRPCLSSPT